ncbi:hypothetical protein HPB50_006126 [Hyalomma asiaticum]|uniref:Uncharacterized protein n=1 Tax=Hyalomma asiaticum TaxID=266040 RepID=A0ACB7SL67_HYAAI|nr:hypothetical protein HPB50_006126 [Hyalomma asiaticum]
MQYLYLRPGLCCSLGAGSTEGADGYLHRFIATLGGARTTTWGSTDPFSFLCTTGDAPETSSEGPAALKLGFERAAWMSATLFEEYVNATDNKMAKRNRKALFIEDNCPGHGKIENLEAVTVEFLPANTTSVLQPMDQAPCSKFVRRLSPTALRMLGFCVPPVCQRRRQMTSQTVRNFVKKSSSLPIMMPPKVMRLFPEYVCVEQDVPVTGEMTDAEIVQMATNGGNGGDNSNDEPPQEVPTCAKMRNLLRLQ